MPSKKLRYASLRQRLLVALLVPLILIFSVSVVLDYRLARETADSAHDQSLMDSIFDLETHIKEHQGAADLDLSSENEAMLRSSSPDKIYFSVRESNGKRLAGDDLPLFAIPESTEVSFVDSEYSGKKVRVALHKMLLVNSTLFVTLAETTVKRSLSQQQILTTMIWPNLAVILATLLAVMFGVKQGLLPLEAIEKEIASRSADELRPLEIDTAPIEIRPMLYRLNALFSQLRAATAAQKRFIADAAHQLRTPVAGLQAQLDLALNEGTFINSGERFERIEEATFRLGHLLNQLLSYARVESSGSGSVSFEQVALNSLAEKSASIFLDRALAKNIDLGFNLNPVQVKGIPWLLQEALANLIDNAIRYAPSNSGVITVHCGKADGQAFLEVEDNGPGIAAEHRESVFERFYRIPGSPSMGCGLGLPIVKEIAELHGAHLKLIAKDSGGLGVRLEFPV
jgi:two-component system sensor histidine kinase TctE